MEEEIQTQNFPDTTTNIPETDGSEHGVVHGSEHVTVAPRFSFSSENGEHVALVPRVSFSSENGELDEQESILLIEKRSFRPFKSAEDYLYAMREDLAEWLNSLYDLNIDVDNFFEMLENGVILCEHANNVKKAAEDFLQKNLTPGKKFSSRYEIPSYDLHFKRDSAPGSFFARDNIHNFIRWCRDLGVHDVLMFETDDLVLRKNEKHVILALLEIARRGARFGMAAPLLVQMEDDIEREIEKDRIALEETERRVMIGGDGEEENGMHWEEQTQIEDTKPPNLIYGPQPQVITNDLLSLDEMVRDLVERCTCGTQFPMIKVSEGKYRIGDTKVLIFVRILRNHVMVRVGGGWDTLHHYLDKHDPCRCKSGHKTAISAKIGFKHLNDGDRNLSSVTYERSTEGYPVSPSPRRRSKGQRNSLEGVSSLRHRSHSPALRRDHSPNCSSKSSSQTQSKEQAQNGTNDSIENNEFSPRKITSQKSSESRDSLSSHIQREDSYLSRKNAIPPNPSSVKNSSCSVRNGSSKSKSPSCENLSKRNNKYKSSADYGRKAWNNGIGFRNETTRRNPSVDSFDGQKISRSNSSVSDGGFEFMLQKEIPTRQSARLGNNRVHAPVKYTKSAWNGRNQHNYSTLGSEPVRPPKGAIRSARSASASPATTRKSYTSSAPTTPGNRSPKRPNFNASVLAPVLPPTILNELPNVNGGDKDAEILAQLEGFVNNYRAYVLDKLASEGRTLPPDLVESEKENDVSSQKNQDYKSLKATPRKAGVGSRIPAPVF